MDTETRNGVSVWWRQRPWVRLFLHLGVWKPSLPTPSLPDLRTPLVVGNNGGTGRRHVAPETQIINGQEPRKTRTGVLRMESEDGDNFSG